MKDKPMPTEPKEGDLIVRRMSDVAPRVEKVYHGKEWGKWVLDLESKTLSIAFTDGRWHEYEIDLEKITDSASMLDWIFQLQRKTWTTPETIYDLLRAFDAIFAPQAKLCSSGHDKKINQATFWNAFPN